VKLLILDLLPAYISFEFQSVKSDGTKFDPTGTPTVSIYKETGVDSNYDNTQITGSPFDMAKINSKTGNYGVLVEKSLFTAGNLYRALYEATVDGVNTSKIEVYFATSSTSFKADITALALQSTSTSILSEVQNATYGLSALKTLIDAIDTSTELTARFDEIKGSGWTTETLKAIKDVVDAISIENFTGSPGSA
jgi:hypothetical protein